MEKQGLTLLIGAVKGGVGKSTTAISLAAEFAARGLSVCLIDADPQRSAAQWHQIREDAGLEPAITLIEKTGNITSTVQAMAQRFELVIVDIAGRGSRELITGAAAADIVVTPAQCTQFDLDSLSELLELLQAVRDINPRLRLFALQTFASTNAQNKERERVDFLGYLEALEDLPALDSLIRYRRPYRDCISGGMSAAELEPNSAAAAEVEALADEINRIVMGETLEASA